MAVIDKNRHGLAEPGCGENQVRDLVAIHVASGDLQAADRRDDRNRLPPRRAQLQLDPIIRGGNAALAGFNANQVGEMVAVEVCHRKWQSGADRD